jgi:hypothetical protein
MKVVKADVVSYSPQLIVFSLCFNQNGNIRLGVFPEREKIAIKLARSCSIALKHGSACEADVCKRIQNPAIKTSRDDSESLETQQPLPRLCSIF